MLCRCTDTPPNPVQAAVTEEHVGQRVIVDEFGLGVLRFFGETEFGRGYGAWLGIELDEPLGKNDGAIGQERCFSCAPNHGVFALGMARGVRIGTCVPWRLFHVLLSRLLWCCIDMPRARCLSPAHPHLHALLCLWI